jgi:hypothetical protein
MRESVRTKSHLAAGVFAGLIASLVPSVVSATVYPFVAVPARYVYAARTPATATCGPTWR